MSKFDPPPGELKFRLIVSVLGLLLMFAGIVFRSDTGWGPGAWETVIIASVFFGGSAVWTLVKLAGRSED